MTKQQLITNPVYPSVISAVCSLEPDNGFAPAEYYYQLTDILIKENSYIR